MWEIIHWYFLYMIRPNPFFHVVASSLLYLISFVTISKPLSKKDILPSIALFCMYGGFYLTPTLTHLAFTPWWVVCLTGLRRREFFIWIGGVMVGILFMLSNTTDIIAHVVMNLSQMMHPLRMSLKARSIVHFLCVGLYIQNPAIHSIEYRDVLCGLSCVLTSFVKTRPDMFSLAMVFSGPVALCTFILHAMEINWYKFYRNNHFRRVKKSYYFIYPIVIITLACGINVFSYIPSKSY